MKHQHRINGNHLQPTLKKVAATVLAVLSSYAHANSANSHAYQHLDSAEYCQNRVQQYC